MLTNQKYWSDAKYELPKTEVNHFLFLFVSATLNGFIPFL
jgi:hypothetical protein